MARSGTFMHGRQRLWAFVLDVDRFVRLHFLFFSCLWPLLGAASVRTDPSNAQLAALLLVALCFHIYAFVLNDVIDLPIDRSQPLRQADPLVRGAISRREALAFACLQPALTVPLTWWLGGGVRELSILAVGFASMCAYNLWGKRCPIPPVTDLIQGIAWGSLAIYAAFVLGPAPTAMTWMVAAYAAGYTLFMNGVHGGLRDLANDVGRGAQTTAIFLGARPGHGGGDPHVPKAVAIFAFSVLMGLVAINAALMLRNDFGYEPAMLTATAVAVAALNVAAVVLMPQVVKPRGPAWGMAFRLQIYLVLMSLPVAFLGSLNAPTIVALAVLQGISLAVFDRTAVILRWAWVTICSALGSEERALRDARVTSTDA